MDQTDKFYFTLSTTILLGVNGGMLQADLLEDVVLDAFGNAVKKIATEDIHVVCLQELIGEFLSLNCCL